MDKSEFLNLGLLGQGGSSKVYLVENIKSKQKFAMKEFEKGQLNDQYLLKLFQSEIEIMKILQKSQNNHIVKLQKVINTNKHFYVIMEYCNQGNLNDYIIKNGPLTEFKSVNILLQIINGLKELNQYSIIHRDIKAENILLDNDIIKIADFGFAILNNQHNNISDYSLSDSNQLQKSALLGTPPYIAPELINENIEEYSSKIDIWALGVLYFYMIFQKFPFYYLQQRDTYIQNNKNKFMYFVRNEEDFQKSIECINCYLLENLKQERISDQSYSFLTKVLIFDPKKRMKWQEMFKHELLWKYIDNYDHIIPKEMPNDKEQMNVLFDDIEAQYNSIKDNIFFIKFIIQQLLINSSVIKKLQDQTIYILIIKQFINLFTNFFSNIQNKSNILNTEPRLFEHFVQSYKYQPLILKFKQILEQLQAFQNDMNIKVIKKDQNIKTYNKLQLQEQEKDFIYFKSLNIKLSKKINDKSTRNKQLYQSIILISYFINIKSFIKENQKELKSFQINFLNFNESQLIDHLNKLNKKYQIKQ